MPENKKMGRPIIGKKKGKRLEILLDEDTEKKLIDLSNKKKISKAEVIRLLINEAK